MTTKITDNSGRGGATIECAVEFERRAKRRKLLRARNVDAPSPPPLGRVPRIAKLMALAIRLDDQLRAGQFVDYAELARLGHVSRARITQIMNLRLLAPDIQEALLHLPRVERGRAPMHLTQLQPIAAELRWERQRRLWKQLLQRSRPQETNA